MIGTIIRDVLILNFIWQYHTYFSMRMVFLTDVTEHTSNAVCFVAL